MFLPLTLAVIAGLAGAVAVAYWIAWRLDKTPTPAPEATPAAAANMLVAYAYPALLRMDRARARRIAADAAGDARCAATLVKDAAAHLSDAPVTAYPAERDALRVLIAKHDLLARVTPRARTTAEAAELVRQYEAAGYVRFGTGAAA